MNTQVPVINLEELAENAEFICEVLVGRNKMSFRVTSEDHGDVLLVPVIEKAPIPEDLLSDIEEMQKMIDNSNLPAPPLPPPLDMPF
jgi:hypothetical protein